MYKKVLVSGLTNLPVKQVRAILLTTDAVLLGLMLSLSTSLVYGRFPTNWPREMIWVFPAVFAIGLAAILLFRLQRIKLIMLNFRDIINLGKASFAISMGLFVIGMIAKLPSLVSLVFVFAFFSFAAMVGARAFAISFLGAIRERHRRRKPVAIFGAGPSGIQMASVLHQSIDMRPVVFFDDNPTIQGMEIGGIPVLSPHDLAADMYGRGITKLIIALPESARARQSAIVELCDRVDIEAQVLPSFFEFLNQRDKSGMRPVDTHDLLGRGKVDLDVPEVAKSYAGRVVMVSGAGGSIGSELCRQLLNCRPAKIVLFEQSEYNLYRVDLDLAARAASLNVEVTSCLGSITDPVRVRSVMEQQGVEIIVHAAAYKHVPMVECNVLEGARNNVLGTKILCDAAVAMEIERFILVSTDKAVRPTSIMGATKRLAELVVQDVQTRAPQTRFAMVRFGNVLGSSGSVLPRFQEQIDAGGPVTVTHPDIRRFFMTMSEAARLILLAGAYSTGGDVFVLNMGRPQNIMEIAKKMIHLSGRTVFNPETGEGDIEIKVTGLRPGEKLYEELFVDANCLGKTPHPKIMRAEEAKLSQIEIAGILRETQAALDAANPERFRKLVSEKVDGYASAKQVSEKGLKGL